MKRRPGWGVVLLLAFLAAPMGAVAEENGTLDRIEHTLESGAKQETGSGHHHHSGYTFWDFLFDFLLAGLTTPARDSEAVDWKALHQELKGEGHPAVPTLQFDAGYSYFPGDVHAYRVYGLAGYLPFAIDVEWLHLFERQPATRLKIVSPHFLFRFLPAKAFELDLAVGAKVIRGRSTHHGAEVGIPFAVYFNRHLWWDVRPYVAGIGQTEIWDVSSGLGGKWNLLTARAGYRLIDIGGERLHGPEVTLGLRW
ncbi:MAG: hypothetical protein HY543_06360 [Deltaproteobacteria bacterium]|nr:hypothetical protein [Deltaproteobacteria bacterium]